MADTQAQEAQLAAKVTLANKDVEVESSNAVYFIASATVLSAIAVTFIVMKNKKGDKATTEPLLASDDEFKAAQ